MIGHSEVYPLREIFFLAPSFGYSSFQILREYYLLSIHLLDESSVDWPEASTEIEDAWPEILVSNLDYNPL